MKIITDNSVYVQRKDLKFLNTNICIKMPETIICKIFEDSFKSIKSDEDFIKFEDDFDMEFLKDIDWIINYNDVKDLTEEELIELGEKVTEQKNELSNKFYSMDINGRLKNFDIITRCDLLKYKMQSLADVIFYKRGKLDIKLPEEVNTGVKEKIK